MRAKSSSKSPTRSRRCARSSTRTRPRSAPSEGSTTDAAHAADRRRAQRQERSGRAARATPRAFAPEQWSDLHRDGTAHRRRHGSTHRSTPRRSTAMADGRGTARSRHRRRVCLRRRFPDRRLPDALGRHRDARGVVGRARRSARPPSVGDGGEAGGRDDRGDQRGRPRHPSRDCARPSLSRSARTRQSRLGASGAAIVARRRRPRPTAARPLGAPMTATEWLRDSVTRLPARDEDAHRAVTERASEILRPSGALARLDEVAAWVAGWQRTNTPAIRHPSALIFAGDHGVTAAGVSKYPTDVTSAMLAAYRAGKSTITAFAAVAGASVDAIDVGVGRPTADIRYEAAMSPARFEDSVAAGRDAVDRLDPDLLVPGERGIGNTPAAAAVAAALGGGEVAAWVGRGTGIDDEGLSRKRDAVREAVGRIVGVVDPLEVLREVGGAELVAMAA